MKKRLIGIVLSLLMLLSTFGTGIAGLTPSTAVADAAPIDQAIVQGGAILHCFDWSYNEIRAALPDIAAAGYVAVQTSPVQPAKDYNGSWTDTGGNWWKLYQPLGLRIADGSETWLGTKAELKALCDEAENYGIYVIVDVVANHTANVTGGGYTVNGTYNVSEQVDEELQDPDGSKGLYHTSENGTNDGSRYNMTQYHLSMPDLNTGNQVVQDMVLDFLKECVDCGVDGFRFDAAKHIELPGDSGCSSDFWPYVIGGIRDYAGSNNLYIYGESLSGSGSDAWVNEFITYIGLTDSQTGNAARDAVNNQNAGALAVGTYSRGDSPKDYVLWAESHDTYEDGGSTGVSSDKIVRTWAIVGARADSTALFLARPNERMGLASSDTSWKSTAVAEVNKFKTHYDGTGEYLSYDQDAKVTWIERGNAGSGAGVVIDKLDGAGWVELTAHLMSDGIYKDEITGNNFAVTGGTITGNVGPTGVAVVYNTAAGEAPTPPETSSQTLYLTPASNWMNDGARFAVYTFGGGEHWYSMNLVDGTTNVYSAEITNPYTNVIFCRMNPATTANNWSNKWNQTADLTVPSDKNWYKVAEGTWDSGGGTWDVYGTVGGGTNPIEVTEDAGYYLVGTMTGWSVLPEYKMTRTGASTEEYTIDVPLLRTSKPFHSQFKVVYSPDGMTAQTWYPDGFDNNYGDYDGEIPQSGVYSVYFRPGYDGSSDWHDSCLYAERTKYFVTVNDADRNGTVTVDKEIAAAGETVTVTVTPNAGYSLESLVYMCETGFNTGEFTTTEISGTTFTMPAENAAVKATFAEDGALSDGYYLVDAENAAVENIDPENKLTKLANERQIMGDDTTFVLTGNFGADTYQIVKVADGEIVPFTNGTCTVETTGVTETVYLFLYNPTMFNDWWTGVSSLDGYYLDIGNTPVTRITEDYAFTETETSGLYLLERILYHSDIYVVEMRDGLFISRYPAGNVEDTTETAQNLNGTPFGWGNFDRLVRVSFRPDGQGTPVGTEYMGDYGKWFHGYFISEVLNRVIINESQHGTVTADKMIAEEGETVTLTITPDPGYELDTLTVVNDYNETIEVTDNTFEMTIWEAKVTATFKEAPTPVATFTAHKLLLSGEIGVMFKVTFTDATNVEGSYVTFTYADGRGSVTRQMSDATQVDDVTYWFTAYINALELNDAITATLHCGDATVEDSYVAMTYIEAARTALASNTKLIALIDALQNYGHYLQASGWADQLTHETIPACSTLGADDIAAARDGVADMAVVKELENSGVTEATISLTLNSQTRLNVTVTLDEGVTMTSTQGEELSDGRYRFTTVKIGPRNLGKVYTITVTTDVGTAKVKASPMSYVYAVLNAASMTEAQQLAMAAYYNYYLAASAY